MAIDVLSRGARHRPRVVLNDFLRGRRFLRRSVMAWELTYDVTLPVRERTPAMMKRKIVLIVAALATTGFSLVQLACGGGDRAQEQPPVAQAAPPAPAPEPAPPPVAAPPPEPAPAPAAPAPARRPAAKPPSQNVAPAPAPVAAAPAAPEAVAEEVVAEEAPEVAEAPAAEAAPAEEAAA